MDLRKGAPAPVSCTRHPPAHPSPHAFARAGGAGAQDCHPGGKVCAHSAVVRGQRAEPFGTRRRVCWRRHLAAHRAAGNQQRRDADVRGAAGRAGVEGRGEEGCVCVGRRGARQ
eukprot:279376-Chlamydomonas_euryale.AAC.2